MSDLDAFNFADGDRIKTFKAGEVVYSQGDAANGLCVVVEGEAQILVAGQVLETVRPPNFFGEMALISNTARSATVIAKTDLKIEIVDEKRFEFMVRNTPNFAVDVMRVMAGRLRHMDETLSAKS